MSPKADTLDRAWIAAEASLPQGWQLMGLARGPREADPKIMGSSWVAWAKSQGERLEGSGESPSQALNALAARLRERRGDANG